MSDELIGQEVVIHDDPDEAAYLIEVGEVRAGKAEYRMMSGRRVFTHTEVADEFSGRGLANQVARFALDAMRDQGVPVVPLCPFFAAYIRRHPEYDAIVDHEMTMELKKRRQ
ncbi:MAG TPA: GNAT family N-acetyltransferase [Acidimicrobiia bacterium]|nr:GNAT family N-acetyltransferase [Acidimicrobiia bacterium]